MDREFWRLHHGEMTKTAERIELPEIARRYRAEAVELGVPIETYLSELMRKSTGLTNEQIFAMAAALPPADSSGETSADIIRELRGPLPDDEDDDRP
jgi:hypothetical protein